MTMAFFLTLKLKLGITQSFNNYLKCIQNPFLSINGRNKTVSKHNPQTHALIILHYNIHIKDERLLRIHTECYKIKFQFKKIL